MADEPGAAPEVQTWRAVWARRTLDPSRGSVLAQLMAADGLDTGFGSVGEAAWRDFVRRVAAHAGMQAGESVWEVGCGAGAFLHELGALGCRIGGLDASPALIAIARRLLPYGAWAVGDALEVAPGHDHFDWVVACGVFLYFPDETYAHQVLAAIAARARRGVLILDVPDLARREAALTLRRTTLGEAEYAARYAGLDHLFLDRDRLAEALRHAGCIRVETADQSIPGYANAASRFNLFGWLRPDPPGSD